jgi:hypothetical protein
MNFAVVEICGDFLLSSDSREEVAEVERSCVLVRPWPSHKHQTNPKALSFCYLFQMLKFLDFSKNQCQSHYFTENERERYHPLGWLYDNSSSKVFSKKLKYKSIFSIFLNIKRFFDWSMTEEERLAKNEKIRLNYQATRAKRSNQVCRVFKVKIDQSSLSKKQAECLKMMFVEAKWVQNDMIRWSNLSDDNKIWEYKLGSTVTKKNKDFEDETVSLKLA